jgi:hypothetical protein
LLIGAASFYRPVNGSEFGSQADKQRPTREIHSSDLATERQTMGNQHGHPHAVQRVRACLARRVTGAVIDPQLAPPPPPNRIRL